MTALSSTRARLALALASGVVQAAAHARIELAVGTVIAAALLALAVDRAAPRIGACCGLIFGGIVGISFASQSAAVWMVAVGLLCFGTLCSVMGLLGAMATAEGRPPWLAGLGLPAVAWIYETLNGLGPLGDYLGLAAAVTGLPLLSLAAWGGPGTAAAAAVGIGVAVAYLRDPGRRRTMGLLLAGWLVLGAAAHWRSEGTPLTVGAVVHAPTSRGPDVLRDLARATHDAVDAGAQLVVWPEAALRADSMTAPAPLWAGIRRVAADAGVPLVVGVFVRERNENLAILVTADGLQSTYSKNRLIPAMEHYTPGADPPTAWDAGLPVPLGTIICFDDCFAPGPRRLAGEGAGLLAIPTNDWPRVEHRHRRLSMLRAAQTRLPVVRAASGGISQILSSRGAVLAEHPAPTDAPVVLVGTVEVRP